MVKGNNQEVFLALVKAGLWETEARLLLNEEVDYSELLRLAEEQSVVGLMAAGLEHTDGVPYETKLPVRDLMLLSGLPWLMKKWSLLELRFAIC